MLKSIKLGTFWHYRQGSGLTKEISRKHLYSGQFSASHLIIDVKLKYYTVLQMWFYDFKLLFGFFLFACLCDNTTGEISTEMNWDWRSVIPLPLFCLIAWSWNNIYSHTLRWQLKNVPYLCKVLLHLFTSSAILTSQKFYQNCKVCALRAQFSRRNTGGWLAKLCSAKP